MGRRDIPQYTPKHFHKEMSYSPFSCGRRTSETLRLVLMIRFAGARDTSCWCLWYVVMVLMKRSLWCWWNVRPSKTAC